MIQYIYQYYSQYLFLPSKISKLCLRILLESKILICLIIIVIRILVGRIIIHYIIIIIRESVIKTLLLDLLLLLLLSLRCRVEWNLWIGSLWISLSFFYFFYLILYQNIYNI